MGRNRLSGVTSKGLEASLIGLTMAGCIGVGYLIGNWLDGRMGTTYWTPVMVILGIIAGAREMWITVSRIRESFSDGTFNDPGIPPEHALRESPKTKENRAAIVDPGHRKPRFFHVPPPPAPGATSAEPPQLKTGDPLKKQLSELRRLQKQIEAADEEDEASSSSGTKKHESE